MRSYVIWEKWPTGLDLNLTLLPQSLKAVGYSTHAVGKWHLGFCSWAYTPLERGFDTFYGFYSGGEYYYSHIRPPIDISGDDLWASCEEAAAENVTLGYDFRNNTEPDLSADGTYSTYLFSSYVEKLLSSLNPEAPMFLYLAFQSVHFPNEVPEIYTEPYSYVQDEQRRIKLALWFKLLQCGLCRSTSWNKTYRLLTLVGLPHGFED
nr:arylsulfatase B-like [Procambarus clarkii]